MSSEVTLNRDVGKHHNQSDNSDRHEYEVVRQRRGANIIPQPSPALMEGSLHRGGLRRPCRCQQDPCSVVPSAA